MSFRILLAALWCSVAPLSATASDTPARPLDVEVTMDREVLAVGDTVTIHMTVSSTESVRFVQATLATSWELIPSHELLEQKSEEPHLWNTGFLLGKGSVTWRGELALNESLSIGARFRANQCGRDTVSAACYDPTRPFTDADRDAMVKIPVCVRGIESTPTEASEATLRRRPQGDKFKEMIIDGERVTVVAPDYHAPTPKRSTVEQFRYNTQTERATPSPAEQESDRSDGCCESNSSPESTTPEQHGSSSESFYIGDCFPGPSSSPITGLRQIVSEYCMTFWYLDLSTGDTAAMDNWHADPPSLGTFETVPGRDVVHFIAGSSAQTGRIYGTVGNPPQAAPDYDVRVVRDFGVRGAFEYEPDDFLGGTNLPMDNCVTTLYFGDEFGGTTFSGIPDINFAIDQETETNIFGSWNFPFVSVDHVTIAVFSYDFGGIRAVVDDPLNLYSVRTAYFPLLAAWVGVKPILS